MSGVGSAAAVGCLMAARSGWHAMWGGPGLEAAFGQLDVVDAGSLGWIAECLPTDILHNIHYAKWVMTRLLAFVGSGWRWLTLWIGSCFPSRTPNRTRSARVRQRIRVERRLGVGDSGPAAEVWSIWCGPCVAAEIWGCHRHRCATSIPSRCFMMKASKPEGSPETWPELPGCPSGMNVDSIRSRSAEVLGDRTSACPNAPMVRKSYPFSTSSSGTLLHRSTNT